MTEESTTRTEYCACLGERSRLEQEPKMGLSKDSALLINYPDTSRVPETVAIDAVYIHGLAALVSQWCSMENLRCWMRLLLSGITAFFSSSCKSMSHESCVKGNHFRPIARKKRHLRSNYCKNHHFFHRKQRASIVWSISLKQSKVKRKVLSSVRIRRDQRLLVSSRNADISNVEPRPNCVKIY